ncbi:hypothetical protein AB1Y20_010942 [Prymnesium parvum]|uniref:Uncharacterized protein n=1 Tax=Prymnesium parvum TaxID=97485 RepID=A0AB34IPY7_PRYPA
MAPPWALALLSGGFFWLSYLYALPALCKRLLPDAYGAFNPFNRRCFSRSCSPRGSPPRDPGCSTST